MIGEFGKYKKLDKIVDNDPTQARDYMKVKTLYDTRLIFRLRTEMLDVKDNMRNRNKGNNVYCEACDSNTAESQLHVMACPGYAELRAGKDMSKDKDLVDYFREVMLLREKRKCKK